MGILDLFFPQVCVVCRVLLVTGEKSICLRCLSDMPLSFFWNWRDNPAHSLFTEKVELKAVTTLMLYRKESRWRKAIHLFKYQGDKFCGEFLSSMLANRMAESGEFDNIDLIIPVPLHPIKRWRRGFNQSSLIAKNIGIKLQKPVIEGLLIRRNYSSTQTKRDRGRRRTGVENAFLLKNGKKIERKRILLVDDVITTGATIEACAAELYKAEGIELSVAALAFVE